MKNFVRLHQNDRKYAAVVGRGDVASLIEELHHGDSLCDAQQKEGRGGRF